MYNGGVPIATANQVFKAIAHPARRQMLEMLYECDRSVTDLTQAFEMSQPAVSQHLRELREASLVTSKKVGLERRYSLTAEPIRLVFDWSRRYKRFFDPSGHMWSLTQGSGDTSGNADRPKARQHGR